MMTSGSAEWQRECLISANRLLEKTYQRKPSACIALLISRHYRLLQEHYEHPESKHHWQLLSQRWWDLYCRQRQIASMPVFDFPVV